MDSRLGETVSTARDCLKSRIANTYKLIKANIWLVIMIKIINIIISGPFFILLNYTVYSLTAFVFVLK